MTPAKRQGTADRVSAGPSHSKEQLNAYVPYDPINPVVSVAGATYMNVGSMFDLQTNGRGLHNIIFDPSDAMKVHACMMVTTSNDPSDTATFDSRRIVYVYSSDGGITWSSPKNVSGTVRTGYPDMLLYKRGNDYVPIIAAHRYAPGSTKTFESAIFVEQGAPGEGNFKEFDCDRKSSDGTDKDLLWPAIAASKDGSKIYMIADFSDQLQATAKDYFEFGTFTMSEDGKTATWDGWKNQPGLGDQSTFSGYCQSGQHVIRVKSDGTIGVAWINADAPNFDHGLYYVESSDGGATWPATVAPYIPAVVDQENARAIAPNSGIDFYYLNDVPNFVWHADMQNSGEEDSDGYYFPYTGQIFFWHPGLTALKCINYNDNQGYIINYVHINGDSIGAEYLYQESYFNAANVAQGVDFPHMSSVALPVLAPTDNPQVMGVFYEGIVDGDQGTIVSRDESEHTAWYSNLFYQYTTDGGNSWSDVKPFKVNPTPGDPSSLDYRYPQVPPVSTVASSGSNFHVMFMADSLPGYFSTESDRGNGAGLSLNYWFHQNYVVDGVANPNQPTMAALLGQNYPNPASGSTTIPVSLEHAENVTITIGDMLGREISTVYSGVMTEGYHAISAATLGLAPGIYRYSIKTATQSESRLMTIIQ